jgi:hypothetical protein
MPTIPPCVSAGDRQATEHFLRKEEIVRAGRPAAVLTVMDRALNAAVVVAAMASFALVMAVALGLF